MIQNGTKRRRSEGGREKKKAEERRRVSKEEREIEIESSNALRTKERNMAGCSRTMVFAVAGSSRSLSVGRRYLGFDSWCFFGRRAGTCDLAMG